MVKLVLKKLGFQPELGHGTSGRKVVPGGAL
jgi:hypothetical protein